MVENITTLLECRRIWMTIIDFATWPTMNLSMFCLKFSNHTPKGRYQKDHQPTVYVSEFLNHPGGKWVLSVRMVGMLPARSARLCTNPSNWVRLMIRTGDGVGIACIHQAVDMFEIYPMVKVHGTVPKRWVNTGIYKPIHGNCAIYFYPGVCIYIYLYRSYLDDHELSHMPLNYRQNWLLIDNLCHNPCGISSINNTWVSPWLSVIMIKTLDLSTTRIINILFW